MNSRKLTRVDAVEIYTSNDTVSALAKRYGVSSTLIYQVRQGKVWGLETALLPEPERRQGARKLTNLQVMDIFMSFESPAKLATEYDINEATIQCIRNRLTRKNTTRLLTRYPKPKPDPEPKPKPVRKRIPSLDFEFYRRYSGIVD